MVMGKKVKKLGAKFWLNVIAVILVIVVLFFSRDQLIDAWKNMENANLWILLLLIPLQILSYYAKGMSIFSYLRGRGKLQKTKKSTMAAMALELNFVNHVFPSGGLSGASYMVWRLGKKGICAGQATMSQIVQYLSTMVAFILLLMIALIVVAITNDASNFVVILSATFVTAIIFVIFFASYLINDRKRLKSFARWLTRAINKVVYAVTFHKKRRIFRRKQAEKFFFDIHDDFIVIKKQKSLLIKPIVWSLVFIICDVMLFFVAFWALGVPVNPALVLIAYGAASMVGTFVTTPGGVGGFEGVMIIILGAWSAAGVVLARVILIIGTLISGYVFYHLAIKNLGKPDFDKPIDLTPNDEIREAKSDGKSAHTKCQ